MAIPMSSPRAADSRWLGAPGCGLETRSNHTRARAGRAALLTGACVLVLAGLPLAAQARTYFRSASSVATASASSVTLSAPPNTTVGDLLLMNVDTNGGATTFTAPAGWTSVNAATNYAGNALGGGYSILAYRVATSADVGASYVISLGTTRAAAARIVDYVGVETSSPFENTFPAGTNPTGGTNVTSFNYPSVTTTASNTMVVFGAIAFPTGGATTITPPAGATQRVALSVTGTSPDLTTEIDDFVQATAGTVSKSGSIAASSPWGAGTIALTPAASGTFQFDVAPEPPALGTVTLKGQAQTTTAKMNDFAVDDTSSESGWNVTVNGSKAGGASPVFKQYCENGASACGATPAHSYVSGGQELPAGSLQLNTSGASWTTNGGAGAAPAFQCSSTTCAVDAASATKIVSTASGGGLGPWSTTGFKTTSLTLSTPSTLRVPAANVIYRVDLVWTLSTGP
jgi:hypothetical protein